MPEKRPILGRLRVFRQAPIVGRVALRTCGERLAERRIELAEEDAARLERRGEGRVRFGDARKRRRRAKRRDGSFTRGNATKPRGAEGGPDLAARVIEERAAE